MTNPMDPEFWTEESEILFEILFPLFRAAALKSALASFEEIAGMVDIGISWNVFNDIAIVWAQQHTTEVVGQISKTSMAAFLQEFEPWLKSGEALPDLVEKLVPYYGEMRAEMVAVTEVTRAFSLGNLAVWKNTGMVVGFKVQTAEDDVVCPICEEEKSRNPHPLDAEPPPYHVRCRCWLQPVLNDHE